MATENSSGKAAPRSKAAKATKQKASSKKKPVRKKAIAKKKPAAKKAAERSTDKAGSRQAELKTDFSIRQIAKLFGCSDSTVRENIKNGAPVKATTGKNRASVINITDYHKWLIALSQGEGNDLADTRLERQRQDLRRQIRENDEAEGRVIPIDQVEFFFQSILVMISNRLEGVGGKSSGGDPVIRNRIQDETRYIRVQMFQDIVEFLRPFSGDRAADLATSQAAKLEVGDREKDTT